ncbi:hypothetical protein CYMTET_3225 [Cymbomonas tetramitiformis]|uniref:Uncharacterized protein n=1 Tax=Cymbomonas tetramitiformis TaxID=36881 RepID=A0AAE0H5H0_9CHLO|nr:hypothetical protein CYMTET_3225 [Cymbomonas tetramitiformis]
MTQWRARAVVDWKTLEIAADNGQGPYVPSAEHIEDEVPMRDREMELDALIQEIRHRNLQVLEDAMDGPVGDSRLDALKAELKFVKGSVDFFQQIHMDTMPPVHDVAVDSSTPNVHGPVRVTYPDLISAYTEQDADRVAKVMAQEPDAPIPDQRMTAADIVADAVPDIRVDDDAHIRTRPSEFQSYVGDKIFDHLLRWLRLQASGPPSRGRATRPFVIFSEASPAYPRVSTFQGVAAAFIPGARTIHNLGNIKVTEGARAAPLKPMNPATKAEYAVRAASDPANMDFIQRCRSEKQPIQQSDLDRLRVLTTSDIQMDRDWLFATVAVTGNRQRQAVNDVRAQHFARLRGQPVIRWKRDIATTLLDSEHAEVLRAEFPDLIGTFVAGAPGIILNNDLNPSRGLANGTPAEFHSLILQDASKSTDAGKINNAGPGEQGNVNWRIMRFGLLR